MVAARRYQKRFVIQKRINFAFKVLHILIPRIIFPHTVNCTPSLTVKTKILLKKRMSTENEQLKTSFLADELTMVRSFAKLVFMRLEDALELSIHIEEAYLPLKIPHLFLQPQLENTVKHNAATAERPLTVVIEAKAGQLIFSNSRWEIPAPEASNGIGLANLNDRFRILMHQEIEISRSDMAALEVTDAPVARYNQDKYQFKCGSVLYNTRIANCE